MDKNVGGVDLEELMRAREELNRERGVETDPDMYSDYGKDHSQPAEPVINENASYDGVQEEQGYSYNQETNDAYSNDGRTVDNDNDGYAVRPGDNEYGWVADDEPEETSRGESQSFADAFASANDEQTESLADAFSSVDNEQTESFADTFSSADNEQTESLADAFSSATDEEPSYEEIGYRPAVEEPVSNHFDLAEEESVTVQEEVQTPVEPEQKDLNMYDIFAEFEVKENANISSTIDLGAIAAESADPEPEVVQEEPVVENNYEEPTAEPVVENSYEEPTAEPVVENNYEEPAAEPVAEEVVYNEPEQKSTGINDLIDELLAGYDLDADPEPEEVHEESAAEPVETENSAENEQIEEVHDAMEAPPAEESNPFDMLSAFEVNVESAPSVEEPKVEEEPAQEQPEEISQDEEVKNYVETISNHDLIGGEENAHIDESEDVHVDADDGILDGDEPETTELAQNEMSEENEQVEETEESAEEPADVEEETEESAEESEESAEEQTKETEESAEDAEETEEVEETPKDSVTLVHELQSELFSQYEVPTTAPPSNEEKKTNSVDSGETEVITDYSKLKDILQQELEEAERAEIEKIEEVKAEVVKGNKQYGTIEQFNFVDEIVNEEFKESDKLSYLIGKDENGKCVYGNFKEQFNLVIFGKEHLYTNTLVNSILLSLSLKNEVSDTNFIILDADINSQFEIYNKSSYIFFNRIAKTNKEILDTLIEVSKELDDRYNKLAAFGVKDIEQYNVAGAEAGVPKMPYLVVVFNNYTKSSQATDNDKIVACLHRVLKYGRIAGMYAVVVATNPIEQDEINYNLPSRIALKNEDDSIYTIGESGASSLVDDNDLLYSNIVDEKVVHLKLPNISETERELLITGLEE